MIAAIVVGIAAVGPRALAAEEQAAEVAILADGKRLVSGLAGIDEQWKISLRGAEAIRVLPASDLVLWGRYRDFERGPQVVLSDGSLIVGDVLHISGQEIVIGDSTGLGRVLWENSSLPRRSVRAILFQPPADSLARDKLLDSLAGYAEREDELRLVGGEAIRGTLLAGEPQRSGPELPGMLPENFRIAIRGRSDPLVVSAAKVVALVLGSSGRREAPMEENTAEENTVATLGLSDGSLLACAGFRVRTSIVELELAAGGTLKALHATLGDESHGFWDEVTLVQPRSPRVKYLSDLQTIGYKHIPFTGIEWPFGKDRNVLSGRLRSGGKVHLKGLGMHSAARLAYDLEPGWKRLEGEVAIDDAAALGGSVIFKIVLQDAGGQWQAAYESPIVRGGDVPLAFSVQLEQATRAALLVEYADRGDVLDYANWLNVRLVK
jgi:hypothetical protein